MKQVIHLAGVDLILNKISILYYDINCIKNVFISRLEDDYNVQNAYYNWEI